MLASIPLFICTEHVATCRATFYIQNSSPLTKNKGGSGRRFTIFSELRFARGSLTMRTATLARGPQPAQSCSRKVCVLAQRNLMTNESSFIVWQQMIHSLLRHGFLKTLKIQLQDTRGAGYDAAGIYKQSAFIPTVRRDTQLGTRCRCL